MTDLGNRWPWPAGACILALSVGSVSGWSLLQHLGLALLLLLAISFVVAWLGALSISAESSLGTLSVAAGERITIRYVLRRRGVWPVVWTVLEPRGFSTLPVQGQLVTLPLRGPRRIDVSLLCPRRGRWPAGGWTLSTGDPFGLFERARHGSDTAIVTVYPRPVALPGLVLSPSGGRIIAPRGMPSSQPAAMVREVRPYHPGDLPSRIHWLSTARLNRLMVREPEYEPAAHTWLVLDLDAFLYEGEDDELADLVLGAASELLRNRLSARAPIGMLLVGPDIAIPPATRNSQIDRLSTLLATTAPAPSDLARSLRVLRTRPGYPPGTRGGTLILLTPWADERWRSRLPAFIRAGYSVLCILLDRVEYGQGVALDDQAAALRAAGVRVHRHTERAA